MKFYLMRHCHTEEGPREDADRGLDDIGQEQVKVMRKFLKRAKVNPDVIISSDFKRAVETAEGIQRKKTPLETTPALRPDTTADKAWKAIFKIVDAIGDRDQVSVLVVTHGPFIQNFLADVAFQMQSHISSHYEHGSVAYVNTHEARFRWFVNPKLAAHLVGAEAKDVENPPKTPLEEAEFARGALLFAENLRRAYRAAALDPLISKLTKATAARFRRQRTTVLAALSPFDEGAINYSEIRGALAAAIPFADPKFAKVYARATKAARNAGADHVAEQLGVYREATPPRKRPAIADYDRTAPDLEADLDTTTQKQADGRLEQFFSSAAPLGYAALVTAINQQFNDYTVEDGETTSRAETVALSEISSAYHSGGAELAELAPGEVEKAWDGEPDMCEDCQGNADMDFIPDDAPFDTGDFEPPAHPNCRCSLIYRTVGEEE